MSTLSGIPIVSAAPLLVESVREVSLYVVVMTIGGDVVRTGPKPMSYTRALALADDWRLEADRAVDHAEVHVIPRASRLATRQAR